MCYCEISDALHKLVDAASALHSFDFSQFRFFSRSWSRASPTSHLRFRSFAAGSSSTRFVQLACVSVSIITRYSFVCDFRSVTAQDETKEVLYWGRQLLGFVIGIISGVIPLLGWMGLSL
jgi:hypothetical protein